MSSRRIAAIVLTGALLAGGTGAAIAAVSKDDDVKDEQAVLDDAAKRLEVDPQKLRDALSAAQDAGLDRAVEDGMLSQEQADAIKERRKESGRVLGGHHGGPGFRPHRGRLGSDPGARGAIFLDLAAALGLTRAQLHEQFRDGKSVADIAKAEGKSLGDVRAAVKADARQRADRAVKDGDLTRTQADRMLSHLDEALEHLDEAGPMKDRRLHHEGPPDLRPGGFVPGDAPDLRPGVFS